MRQQTIQEVTGEQTVTTPSSAINLNQKQLQDSVSNHDNQILQAKFEPHSKSAMLKEKGPRRLRRMWTPQEVQVLLREVAM